MKARGASRYPDYMKPVRYGSHPVGAETLHVTVATVTGHNCPMSGISLGPPSSEPTVNSVTCNGFSVIAYRSPSMSVMRNADWGRQGG